MPKYSYTADSLIDQVTFIQNESGATRAYLHAGKNTTTEQLEEVKQALCRQNFFCLPSNINDEPALELRGFRNEKSVISALKENKWVSGEPNISKEAEKPISAIDKIRKRSLQASGIFMGIADVGFTSYGIMERKWEDAVAGLAYFSGSAVLGAYGKLDQSDLHIRDMAHIVLDRAKQKGLIVPEDTAISEITAKRKETPLRKLHNLFREYPSEVGNMSYFLAGALIARSALLHHALAPIRPGMTPEQVYDMRKEGWQDTALGATTMAGGLIATLKKEKAVDPDKPEHKGASVFFEKFKNSPLAIASALYLGSTLCHAFSTYTAYTRARKDLADATVSAAERALAKKRIKSVPFRGVFVGATIIGELLMMISSKGHGHGVVHDDSVRDSVIDLAAELILKQPKDMQENLIRTIGQYLGQPEVLAMDDEKVERLLRTEVERMQNNPWVKHHTDYPEPNLPKLTERQDTRWQEQIAVPPMQQTANIPLQP